MSRFVGRSGRLVLHVASAQPFAGFVVSLLKNSVMRNLSGILIVFSCVWYAACTESRVEPVVDCAATSLLLKLDSKSDLTSCSASNGALNVSATGGSQPYQFKLNDQAFQSSGTFSNLAAGSYTVAVKDGAGCERSLVAAVQVVNSTLALAATTVVADTQCLNDNGAITVAATGGQGPFQFRLGSGSFGNSSSFTALKSGNYTITVRDAVSCTQTVDVTVPRGNTGVSFANEVKSIIDNNCVSCHGPGSARGDLSTPAAVASRASQVKARTGNGSMPPGGGLTPAQINLIACWVDDGAPNN